MIEVGGIYKLKKIKNFDNNTETDYKVLKISGDTVYCQDQETKELNMFNIKDLIDPEFPDDIYSDFEIIMEKLNTVMKPMNLTFWKDLKEEAAASVSGGMASLGAAPCPAMGQITGGSISGAMINGIPVEGKSVKKKKKKKNEDIITGHELQDWDEQEIERKYNDEVGSPEAMFASFKGDETMPEFEDAVNLLLFGQDEYDRQEYINCLNLFNRTNRMNDFIRYAKKLNITDLDPKNVGSQLTENLDEMDTEIRSMLVQAQSEENSAIKSYLDKALKCKELGQDVLADLFQELANDETVHTGCLQAALNQYQVDDMENVMDGEEEAFEILNKADPEVEEVIESLLNEDFNEAYERITDLLAKQLDRMNFEFANTDEIIYKKEGAYKYLLKFDNENGILKFKISKDENVLVDKQWELDEEQDVQPIFDEIEQLYREHGI